MDAFSKGIERRLINEPWWKKWLLKIEQKRLVNYENLIFDYFHSNFSSHRKVILTRSVAGFLSFQLIFTVNSAHKNYKLYLPYSKTTLHLQNNFFAYGHYDESSLRLRSQKNRIEIS